jgi:hypothetical protein
MLKKILRMSVLTLGIGLTASAAFAVTEEDLAAPPGSFTSDMTAPVNPRFAAFLARHPGFAQHMREHMVRRVALERSRAAEAR